MAISIDLAEQTAIVTGAGRGIGEAVALLFAEAGADVAVAARTASEIEETAARAREHGVDAVAIPTDLADADDIDQLVDETTDTLGTPSILVNNAAACIPGSPLEASSDELDTMVDVNFRGLFLLSQRFAQAALDASLDSGRIINVSSIGSHLGTPMLSLYGATKAGVNGLTRGLAAELAPDGITVNAVSPGLTRSQRIDDILENEGKDVYELDRIPLGYVAEPEDIADVCLLVASDRSAYMTGEEILVDGGVCFTAGLYR